MKTIYSKTAKGMREASGKTRTLSRDLRGLLNEVNGRATVGDLLRQNDGWSEADLQKALTGLADQGYIRDSAATSALATEPVAPAPKFAPPAAGAGGFDDLDFTAAPPARGETAAPAKRQAEEAAKQADAERARREAEESAQRLRETAAAAKREADERAKREAEVQAKRQAEEAARQEAEERAKRAAAEQARREAEESAKRQAEAAARREAEERAKREAAERVRRETEERTRREAEEAAKREAEERAKREAAEQARREAEEKAKRQAEDAARREAEERAKREAAERARREAEERSRREAEEAARREAEERAKREAAEQARREAEGEAKRQAEEAARREAEERAKREAAEEALREVEERNRRQAEEAARREAEERAKREAAEQARRDADERARQEAEEESARQEAEERARQKAEKRTRREAEKELRAGAAPAAGRGKAKLVKLAAGGVFLSAALGLLLAHFISFDGQIPQLAKAAAEQFQQPVKIKSLHLSLFPPHWRLEGVAIGQSGQIQARQIKAATALGGLFGGAKDFSSMEIDSPVLNEEGLGWLLFGAPHAQGIRVGHLVVTNAKIDIAGIELPALDAQADVGADGNWQKIAAASADKKTTLELQHKGGTVEVKLEATPFAMPFGPLAALDDLRATGTAKPGELALSELKGRLFGGALGGHARLKWGEAKSLDGELRVQRMDAARLLPGLFDGGELEGKAVFSLPAAGKTAAPRLDGSFVVRKGALAGVDLSRLLQGSGSGGRTQFAKFEGDVLHDKGVTQARQLRLEAGAMSASGSVDADESAGVRGQVSVELAVAGEHRRAGFVLSGRLKPPYAASIDWKRH